MKKQVIDKKVEEILLEVYNQGVKQEVFNLEKSINKLKTAFFLQDMSEECNHPWHSIIGDGEMNPAKCLKCGKYL